MHSSGKHPCFNAKAKGKYGRVHLPVAPKCNIQCNFCNRDFDCMNETRPGVTSKVLKPGQAAEYVQKLRVEAPEISVVGIAGPGDPFANPDEVFATLAKVKEIAPDAIPCLSSNGLNVLPYVDDLVEAGVNHMTITINAVDPCIQKDIVSWIRYNKRAYFGREAAEILIENQLEAVKQLAERGMTVKVNSIVIPGVNEFHIPEIANKVAGLGAATMNLIPLLPVEGTAFQDLEEPSHKLLHKLRSKVEEHIEPMKHCARCRADAAGLLGKDLDISQKLLKEVSESKPKADPNRKYVAATSQEGIFVNLHLGHAEMFHIFEFDGENYHLHEMRKTPAAGNGAQRWINMAKLLHDCKGLLVGGMGGTPYRYLGGDSSLEIIEMTGLIEEGLDAIYKGKKIRTVTKKEMSGCGSNCSGTGTGCG